MLIPLNLHLNPQHLTVPLKDPLAQANKPLTGYHQCGGGMGMVYGFKCGCQTHLRIIGEAQGLHGKKIKATVIIENA
jgi:hypothetical protein